VTNWRTFKLPGTCRAFTLTEIAIVLGIAEIVIGSVWSYASDAYHNYNVSKTIKEITTITDNIRNHFMGMPGGTSTLIGVNDANCHILYNCIQSLDALGLIPADMRRNSSAAPGASQIDHPMDHTTTFPSGSLAVNVAGAHGNPIIAYSLYSLTKEYCIKILMQLPIAEFTHLGISSSTFPFTGFDCYINNGVPDYSGASYGIPCSASSGVVPMQLSVAQQWCADTGPTNEVDFNVMLR
jgi:hypothetical protein